MEPINESSFESLRVLVVDDSRVACKILYGMLRELRVKEIRVATDGGDALDVIKSGYWPHLIIADFEMPVVNGAELTQTIRASKDEAIKDIPIIMITSYADEDHVRMARDAGVSEFLAKPFPLEKLTSRMHAAIDRPRDFVESGVFTGPDRRRKEDLDFDGEDYRKDK